MDLPGLEEVHIGSTHVSSPSFCIYVCKMMRNMTLAGQPLPNGKSMEADDNFCYIPSYHFHIVCIFYFILLLSQIAQKRRYRSQHFETQPSQGRKQCGKSLSLQNVYIDLKHLLRVWESILKYVNFFSPYLNNKASVLCVVRKGNLHTNME